jgi:hypothetical protein
MYREYIKHEIAYECSFCSEECKQEIAQAIRSCEWTEEKVKLIETIFYELVLKPRFYGIYEQLPKEFADFKDYDFQKCCDEFTRLEHLWLKDRNPEIFDLLYELVEEKKIDERFKLIFDFIKEFAE